MRTPLVPILTSTILIAGVPARAQQAEIYHPDATPPATVVLTSAVTVPLLASQVGRAPLPVIEVLVNGKGPFRFGVETGANFIAISPAIAESIGLKPVGGTPDYPEYRVDSVRIGNALFTGMPMSGEGRASGVVGLLGLPFWANVLLTIDYPANQLTISRDTLPAPDGKTVVSLSRVEDFWGLPLSIAGQPLHAILDTRSTGSIGLTPGVAAPLSFVSPPVVIGRARGAAIAETEVKGGQLAGNVALGKYLIPQPFVEIRSLPPGFPQNPLIGARVLSNFVLSLDQPRARLRLLRAGGDTLLLPVPRLAPPPPDSARH